MNHRISLLLLVGSRPAATQTVAADQPATANVNAAKAGPPISPYVYGQFIEHAGNFIYAALWAELLENRKFYCAVQPKPAMPPTPTHPTSIPRL